MEKNLEEIIDLLEKKVISLEKRITLLEQNGATTNRNFSNRENNDNGDYGSQRKVFPKRDFDSSRPSFPRRENSRGERKDYPKRDFNSSKPSFPRRENSDRGEFKTGGSYKKRDDSGRSNPFERKSFPTRDFASNPSFPRKDDIRSSGSYPKKDKVNSERKEGAMGYEKRAQRSSTRTNSPRGGSGFARGR